MGADGPVGEAPGDPHDALVFRTFADQVHDPRLVLVCDGKGLPFGSVAEFIGQGDDGFDGLPGRRGPLQGDVDQGTVVNPPVLVLQFGTAAPGGFPDDKLALVHVPDRPEGMGDLRDFPEIPVGVPFVDLQQAAGSPVRRGMEIQLSEKIMGVGGIGDHDGSVGAGPFRNDDIGTGFAVKGCGKAQNKGCCSGEKGFSHRFEH